jgi:thiol-disulfide isomerase/thioredoxin
MRLNTMRFALPIFGLVVLTAAGQALTKEQKIERILTLTSNDAMIDQIFQQMKNMSLQMASQAGQASSQGQVAIASDLTNRVLELVKKRFAAGEFRHRIVTTYSEAFSEEEIDGMLAFYESPAGRAAIQKAPQIMGKVQSELKDLLPEVSRLVREAQLSQRMPARTNPVGQIAPDFALADLTGKQVRLGSFRGKTVLLDFWATWCGPCRAELPVLEKLHIDHPDVVLLAINVGENADVVQKFVTESKTSFTTLMGSTKKIMDDYDASGLPTVVIIGTDGKILSHIVGFGPQVDRQLRSVLEPATGAAESGAGPGTKAIAPALAPFTGSWVNTNPATSGITKLQVESIPGEVTVHAWGRCHPSDCDWGATPITRYADGVLRARWDHHFEFVDQELTLVSDGRLRVTTRTYFTDLSQRKDYTRTEYFVRQ